MSNLLRGSVVLLVLSMGTNVAADNTELWGLYPSGIEFSQYDGDVQVSATKVKWFTFAAGIDTLNGPEISLTVDDGPMTVTLESPDAALFKVTANADWQWSEIFSGDFVDEGCEFGFAVEQGTVLLPAPEGYRFGHREILSWSGGLPDVCREKVNSYISRAELAPVMPLHINAWSTVGGLAKPAATGRFEFLLVQDLRRSKRLLPLEQTIEVDADPYMGKLFPPGSAEERFALVQSRMGYAVFEDSFEID